MNKALIKLIAAGMSLALAVTVAVMSTYAWFTLSTSPEVGGATVVIGGSNTIMLAPNISDLMSVGDGSQSVAVNYPGEFSDTLIFNSQNGYNLSDFGGLAPVSTADGINWVIPVYDFSEEQKYVVDTTLGYANQTPDLMAQREAQGNYVFLDFWVYSPVADYRLRVSAGEDEEGCYLIGLPAAKEYDSDEDGIYDSYQLTEGSVSAAAIARVGFLTNEANCRDYDLMAYEKSRVYRDGVSKLKGSLSEQGTNSLVSMGGMENLFTIYEPNGTLHSGEEYENGTYQITSPLNADGEAADIRSILTVQETNTWKVDEEGNQILQQTFQGMAAMTDFRSRNARDLTAEFYDQGGISNYVKTGKFFSNTGNLYTMAGSVDEAWLEENAQVHMSGATSDVFIVDLEKNVPQRIRMFIWLEAADVDNSYDAQETSFALRIELAGGSDVD